MEMTLSALIIISIPGLLSATCSSPLLSSQNSATYPDGEYYSKSPGSHGGEDGNTVGNPKDGTGEWSDDFAPPLRSSPSLEKQQQRGEEPLGRCENGWCTEDGSCSCNPCWSGPTCQQYVDRFSPRFLAEEPFFIVDSSPTITTSPFPSASSSDLQQQNPTISALQNGETRGLVSNPPKNGENQIRKNEIPKSFPSSTSSSFAAFAVSSSSAGAVAGKSNLLDSNLSSDGESKLSINPKPLSSSEVVGGGGASDMDDDSVGGATRSSPLFRIESADDDLGLTCQLGQVGPAATCPCATPRYKVIGASTTFPSSAFSTSYSSDADDNHPEETDINRPSQTSSFFNSYSSVETSLLKNFSASSSTTSDKRRRRKMGTAEGGEDAAELVNCPRATAMKCQKLSWQMFYADEETGDVFLQKGYNLQPETYYFVTLQVSALPVNNTGYKSWKEHIVATLYVKSTSSSIPTREDTNPSSTEFLDDGIPHVSEGWKGQEKSKVDEFVKVEPSSNSILAKLNSDFYDLSSSSAHFDDGSNFDINGDNDENEKKEEGDRVNGSDDDDDVEDDRDEGKGSLEMEHADFSKKMKRKQNGFMGKRTSYGERSKNALNYRQTNSKRKGDADDETLSNLSEAYDVKTRKRVEMKSFKSYDEEDDDDEEVDVDSVVFYADEKDMKESKAKKQTENRNKKFKRFNAKNQQLPYALRADKPHFKYSLASQNRGFISGEEGKSEEAAAFDTDKDDGDDDNDDEDSDGDKDEKDKRGDREFNSFNRKKRQVPEPPPHFKMSISRVDPTNEGNNSSSADKVTTPSAIEMGSATKLRLQMKLGELKSPTNFTLEIETSIRANSTFWSQSSSYSSLSTSPPVQFIVLSAYVISIGSHISFDKSSTNLAPLLIPWRNSTLYDRVVWKWNNVTCYQTSNAFDEDTEKKEVAEEPQEPTFTTSAPTNMIGKRKDEIFIEFEVAPVKMGEELGTNLFLANRWIGFSGTSATSSTSYHHQKEQQQRSANKNNVEKDNHKGDHKEKSDDSDDDYDDDDSDANEMKSTPLSIATSITKVISKTTVKKVTKQFNVIFVPVSAYITFPNGHLVEPLNNCHQDGNFSSFQEQTDEILRGKVVEIRKKIDNSSEGNGVGDGRASDDKITISSPSLERNQDAPSNFIKNNCGSYEDSENKSMPNQNKFPVWELNSNNRVIMSHIKLPVNFSPTPHKTKNDESTNNTKQKHPFVSPYYTNSAPNRKSSYSPVSGHVLRGGREKGFKEIERLHMLGITTELALEGPTEIPQGGWVSYAMKIYLNHSSQFQLRLEPLQGNEIQYQDTVSVGDIRVTKIGKSFSSCAKDSLKNQFRITCRKLNGRRGDFCTVDSPAMWYCPETKDKVDGETNIATRDGEEVNSSSSSGGSSGQGKSESDEEIWNNIGMRMTSRKQEEQLHHHHFHHHFQSHHRINAGLSEEMNEENLIEFEGVIYGFPGSAPGSQFALRAHVHVQSIRNDKVGGNDEKVAAKFEKYSHSDQNNFGGDAENEKTLKGKIVHRKQNIRSTKKGPVGHLVHAGAAVTGNTINSADFIDGKIPVMKEFPAYHYRKRRSVFSDFVSGKNKILYTNNNHSTSNKNIKTHRNPNGNVPVQNSTQQQQRQDHHPPSHLPFLRTLSISSDRKDSQRRKASDMEERNEESKETSKDAKVKMRVPLARNIRTANKSPPTAASSLSEQPATKTTKTVSSSDSNLHNHEERMKTEDHVRLRGKRKFVTSENNKEDSESNRSSLGLLSL